MPPKNLQPKVSHASRVSTSSACLEVLCGKHRVTVNAVSLLVRAAKLKIGLNKKIVDWVERGVHPGAVSFKWHHEPKVLVVTPHPDNKATCTSL